MNKLFGTKKKEPPKPKVPTLQETSKTLGEQSKVIESTINEFNKQLVKIKALMTKQTGTSYKSSQQKALNILKRRKVQ